MNVLNVPKNKKNDVALLLVLELSDGSLRIDLLIFIFDSGNEATRLPHDVTSHNVNFNKSKLN